MCKKCLLKSLILILIVLLFLRINNIYLFNKNSIVDSFTFQPPDDSKTPILNNNYRGVIINPPYENIPQKFKEGQSPLRENSLQSRPFSRWENINWDQVPINKNDSFQIVDHYKNPSYLKYVNEPRGYTVYFQPDVENMP